ncbi:MAG: GNAT family N-acetyltransferase [Terriglobales bacterium]
MLATIRVAEFRDVVAAGRICQRVLAGKKPYQYELNIGEDGCLNLVAEVEGVIAGFITIVLRRWNPVGPLLWQRVAPYIAFVGVLPEYQCHGIGTALIQAAVGEVTARCPVEPRVFLEHAPGSRARRLYELLGFRTLSVIEVVSLTGLSTKTPVMCLELTHLARVSDHANSE